MKSISSFCFSAGSTVNKRKVLLQAQVLGAVVEYIW